MNLIVVSRGKCRGCGKELAWKRSKKGKLVPFTTEDDLPHFGKNCECKMGFKSFKGESIEMYNRRRFGPLKSMRNIEGN